MAIDIREVTGELLLKTHGMTDQEKLEFMAYLHKWTHRELVIVYNKLNGEMVEIVADPDEPAREVEVTVQQLESV